MQLYQIKEVALLIFQAIGMIVTALIICGCLIYLFFCRNITVEELNKDEYSEEDFIDQILQQ